MKRDNGFAVVGITLAIVPPLGLILSIIGLTRSKARGGAGRALSITGIVVSLLAGTGIGTLIAIAGPAPPDPGCITAAHIPSQIIHAANADEAAMSRDQNSPLAEHADAQHLVVDMQSMETRFTTAKAQAQNQSVKAALSALVSDLKTATSGWQTLLNGDPSKAFQAMAAAAKVASDGNALESACNAVDGPSARGSAQLGESSE